MKSYDRVYVTVDLDAIRSNMEAFRKNLKEDIMLCAVVKTDGYGLGAVPVAKCVSDFVWGYAVATVDEALNLRKHGIRQPILVLGYVPKVRYEELIMEEIRFAAYKADEIKAISDMAVFLGKEAIVHVKVDTGMCRIGLQPEETMAFIEYVRTLPGVFIEGMFSHLATADMKDRAFAWYQTERFTSLLRQFREREIEIPICHLGNSAASMEMTEIPSDMFRIGISMYGYYPSDEMDETRVELTPSMELKTKIVHVKTVPAKTSIGYGGSFVTERETVVATVPIGYGDGYPRSLSNKGEMLVRGKRVRIIGRVCMDQTMLDVTDVLGVTEGDCVTVVGRDGESNLTLEEVSGLAGSFNYEFLCNLGRRLPRIYYKNGVAVGAKDYFDDCYDEME